MNTKSNTNFIRIAIVVSIVISIVVASIFAFFSWPLKGADKISRHSAYTHSSSTLEANQNTDPNTTSEDNDDLESDSSIQLYEETPNTEADDIIKLWTIRETKNDYTKSVNPAIHNPEFIKLQPLWSSQIQPFDKVTLPMPNGDIEVILEKSTLFTNGDLNWSGHLSGFEDQYPTTITIGKKTSFGTITTPEGEYTVEIKGNTGIVYKTPRVDELSADDSPDFLIPEDTQ